MRFIYRYGNGDPITTVTVSAILKKVAVTNHTEDVVDRAFGARENVTYQDVLDFFESRTFPRNRSDIDEILDMMELEEYDPYLMCRFLSGRASEDDCWVDFIE